MYIYIHEILKNKGNVKVISIYESEKIDLSTYELIIIGLVLDMET